MYGKKKIVINISNLTLWCQLENAPYLTHLLHNSLALYNN